MNAATLELDEDLLFFLRKIDGPVEKTARECIVLELYRRGIMSGGRAAELLGMSRGDFIDYANCRLGISYFNMTPEELDEELKGFDRP
jgi:predicted HTH domain antitoxin